MAFLRAHPLCQACAQQGVVTPASEPHHIVPRAAGGSDSWSNLKALCHECHSRVTAKAAWGR